MDRQISDEINFVARVESGGPHGSVGFEEIAYVNRSTGGWIGGREEIFANMGGMNDRLENSAYTVYMLKARKGRAWNF